MTNFKSEQKQFGSALALGINLSHLRVAFQKPVFPIFQFSPLPSAVHVASQLRRVVLGESLHQRNGAPPSDEAMALGTQK